MNQPDHDPVEARLASLRDASESLVAPSGLSDRVMLAVQQRSAEALAWHLVVSRTLRVALAVATIAATLSALAALWYDASSSRAFVAASVFADDEP